MNTDRQVLIVEPEYVIARELQMKLEQNNYSVRLSSDANNTLMALRQKRPDLVIADTAIKNDEDDFNILLKIWRVQKLPIIYLSTETSANIVKEPGLEIRGILSKPFLTDNLLALIDSYFEAQMWKNRHAALAEILEDRHKPPKERSELLSICLFDALYPDMPLDAELAI